MLTYFFRVLYLRLVLPARADIAGIRDPLALMCFHDENSDRGYFPVAFDGKDMLYGVVVELWDGAKLTTFPLDRLHWCACTRCDDRIWRDKKFTPRPVSTFIDQGEA